MIFGCNGVRTITSIIASTTTCYGGFLRAVNHHCLQLIKINILSQLNLFDNFITNQNQTNLFFECDNLENLQFIYGPIYCLCNQVAYKLTLGMMQGGKDETKRRYYTSPISGTRDSLFIRWQSSPKYQKKGSNFI